MQLTVILNMKMTQINDDFMDSDTGYQSNTTGSRSVGKDDSGMPHGI